MKRFIIHKKPSKLANNLTSIPNFNEAIAINLHSHDRNIWYFHITNEFTTFSKAGITKNRNFWNSVD